MNNEKYLKIAYKEALKAYKKGDIPVGCVIVKKNKIVAKAYNKKEKNNIATYHAEILAINKACKKLKTWHLDDCILYTTMEPCIMCSGAIIQSRIKKIVYSISIITFYEDIFGIFTHFMYERNLCIVTKKRRPAISGKSPLFD